MAKWEGNFAFTGSLGGVTAYRMKGCDHIVIRSTAGPSKNQIKNGASFERTRENYREFGGVAKAAKHMRQAFSWLHRVADYNFQPALNKVTKAIQKMDRVSDRGERNVYYSRNHDMLKGFNLNKYHLFDTIVRKPVTCSINGETGTAVVTIPSLQRGINLNLPFPTPRFRFVVALGVCDDLMHTDSGYDEHRMSDPQTVDIETAWQPADEPYAGEEITLQLRRPEFSPEHSSLVVTVGIIFDMAHRTFGNDRVPRSLSGSAKILDLAKAIPASKPTLKLPPTLRVPEPAELEHAEEMQELLEQRKEARIAEGFRFEYSDTEEQQPFTFSAAINVNHSRLSQVFLRLASQFPREGVQFAIAMEGVEPVVTAAVSRNRILDEREHYRAELAYDTSLSYGLLFQTHNSFMELIVTETKYIRFRGVDKEQFLKLMFDLDLWPVPQMKLAEEYPLVKEPLSQSWPNAKQPETVIRELMEALKI